MCAKGRVKWTKMQMSSLLGHLHLCPLDERSEPEPQGVPGSARNCVERVLRPEYAKA